MSDYDIKKLLQTLEYSSEYQRGYEAGHKDALAYALEKIRETVSKQEVPEADIVDDDPCDG